jgi:hypothetical protein
MTDNLFEKLFGPTIYMYSDDDAVREGVLVPFIDRDQDTGHRITQTAWNELTTYHSARRYPDYEDTAFYRFFYAELQPLVSAARHEWDYGDILKTDYTFNTNLRAEGLLWYVPNERGGITMMLPEDY